MGNCGRIRARNKDYQNNETFYASAIRDVPNSVYGYFGLGVHYQKNNAFDKAEKMYRAALRVDPEFPKTYNNLGALLTAQRCFQEAAQILTRGIIRHSDYEKNYYSLGNVYFLTGRYELAKQLYLKTLAIMPQHQKALSMLQRSSASLFQYTMNLFSTHFKQINYVALYRKAIFQNMRLTCSGGSLHAEVLIRAGRAGRRIKNVGLSYQPRRFGVASGIKPKVVFKIVWDIVKLRYFSDLEF